MVYITIILALNIASDTDNYEKILHSIIATRKHTISTKFLIIDECPVCYDYDLQLMMTCGHLVCESCYKNMTLSM